MLNDKLKDAVNKMNNEYDIDDIIERLEEISNHIIEVTKRLKRNFKYAPFKDIKEEDF